MAVAGPIGPPGLQLQGERQAGQDVRTQNVTAVAAIANIVKTSLGPVGLDKVGCTRSQAPRLLFVAQIPLSFRRCYSLALYLQAMKQHILFAYSCAHLRPGPRYYNVLSSLPHLTYTCLCRCLLMTLVMSQSRTMEQRS